MGLTINYTITAPANWTPDIIRAKLEEARQFAKTLPVLEVSELVEFNGPDASFQHVRDSGKEDQDDFFWAKIQGQRHLLNPWEPGSSCGQPPNHMLVFSVDPADGCEPMNIGICSYPQHIWKADHSGHSVPAWSLVFQKWNSYPKSRKVMREFMRRWNLKKLPTVGYRRSGWHEGLGHYAEHGLASAIIEKGRYQSHRRGYLPSYGLVSIQDRMKGELHFKFKGTAGDAKKVFDSPEFRADLQRMVCGKDHITPAATGRWGSFCKTQFANDPRCGGWQNFARAHLSVLSILEKMQGLGFKVWVRDEGNFWETRNLGTLAKAIGDYDALIAGMAGAMKDAAEKVGQTTESAMDGRPDFEQLEMKGQGKMTELLTKMAKALPLKSR